MVLHHVAERAGMIVIAAAVLNAHRLCNGDRHVVYVATIPYRLEERVGETERQDVLHCFLAEIVVDPEDLRLLEAGCQNGIQGARRIQVVANRLSTTIRAQARSRVSPALPRYFGI